MTPVTLNWTGALSKAKAGYNLVGNPYPSYLNANTAVNASANLDKSLYYRTKNFAGGYQFESVNTTSGIGTNLGSMGQVTGMIPPMQAFWVRVSEGFSSATLGFDNTMRLHKGGSDLTLRASAVKLSDQQILRLLVSNGVNSDEAVVYFNANAANNYDIYDSRKMSNDNDLIPEIYTLADSKQLVINGLNSFTSNDVIPLGFTTGTANTFSINVSEMSNFAADTHIYLRDNVLNTEQELTVGTPYTFSSDVVSTDSRFALIFKSSSVTTGLNAASDNSSVSVYRNANNQITVNTGNLTNGSTATVYNAVGQKLASTQLKSSVTVINNTFESGVYMVTVNNGGKNITRKVVID
jgi:hypothetical protein